jgi:hypothetical protein
MIDTEEYRRLRELMDLLSSAHVNNTLQRSLARQHVAKALACLERDHWAAVRKTESDKNSP